MNGDISFKKRLCQALRSSKDDEDLKLLNPEDSPKSLHTSEIELIRTVVRKTIEAASLNIANNNKKNTIQEESTAISKEKTKRPEDLSRQELLNWKPDKPDWQEDYLKTEDSTHSDNSGAYKLKIFSFQESLSSIKSMNNNVALLKHKGGTMVDLSGYKDLARPPEMPSAEESSTLTKQEFRAEMEYPNMSSSTTTPYTMPANYTPHPEANESDLEIYAEYSDNVKRLVQLVNELPDGVTKQTGAQIIRLTMESMGISMEAVLSDAQSVQSQLLDLVRSNIKKIEEYKTIIRKLETEIRYHQGKANELSEIIDLFILSNASPNFPVMPNVERHDQNSY